MENNWECTKNLLKQFPSNTPSYNQSILKTKFNSKANFNFTDDPADNI